MPGPEHGKDWVVVRWNMDFGIYYIGPFQSADIAADWAEKNDGYDVNWVIAHLDPTVSLMVRAPGPMPALQPDPEPDPELEEWSRQVLATTTCLRGWVTRLITPDSIARPNARARAGIFICSWSTATRFTWSGLFLTIGTPTRGASTIWRALTTRVGR